ncbi:unnamed protein product [Prorocentrum cordatum]|uniref:Uncharacterized protein n=1 Tax=Prorocentrum cordatum TaxID=2364126 RepID=A0ABN9XTU8_9DINO|nr:unnamed protein product [Polarella glacialis]
MRGGHAMEQDGMSDSVVDLGIKTRCLLDGPDTGAAHSAGQRWLRTTRWRMHLALASQSDGSPHGRGEARAKSLLACVHGDLHLQCAPAAGRLRFSALGAATGRAAAAALSAVVAARQSQVDGSAPFSPGVPSGKRCGRLADSAERRRHRRPGPSMDEVTISWAGSQTAAAR